jgi:hypothetical protein
MPHIHRKPGQVAKGVTLPCQSHVPEEDRIRWDLTILSTAEADEYERALDQAYDDGKGVKEKADGVKAVIARIAVGWDNIVDEQGAPVPFSPAALDLFNLQQLYQIAKQLPAAAGWGGLTKKVSTSP